MVPGVEASDVNDSVVGENGVSFCRVGLSMPVGAAFSN